MSRLYVAAGGMILIVAICAALVLAGQDKARTAAERDALKTEIETRERIDDALVRPDGCAWAERLRDAC